MAYQSDKPIPLSHGFRLRNGQLIGPHDTVATKGTKTKSALSADPHHDHHQHVATGAHVGGGTDWVKPRGPAQQLGAHTHSGMLHVHKPGVVAQTDMSRPMIAKATCFSMATRRDSNRNRATVSGSSTEMSCEIIKGSRRGKSS